MFDPILKVLKQFQADNGVKLEINDYGIIEKRPGNNEVTLRTRKGDIQGILSHTVNEEKLKLINQEVEKQQINADLEVALELGLQFKDYGLIDNVLDEAQTNLAHQGNEVLLVNVWATWCAPCHKPMIKHQQLLQKNEENWRGKVRFICVSVDDAKQIVKDRVVNKGWQKPIHLALLGWKDDHPLIQDYKITEVPFFCLVNKWGKVDFLGHPTKIDLQKRINELLSQNSDPLLNNRARTFKSSIVKKAIMSKNQVQSVIKQLNKQQVQKKFQNADLVVLRYSHKIKLQNGIETHNFQIKAYIIDGDIVAENKLQQIFGKYQNVLLNLIKVKYSKIPIIQNPDCFICHQKNLHYPYYWLKWEGQNNFGCKKCIQKKSTNEGHHYEYEKNSILLCGAWKQIAQKDAGNNIQPNTPSQVKDEHSYGCNGCGDGIKTIGYARYVSLGIRSDPNFNPGGNIDLCEQCINKLTQNNQEVIDKLADQGYSPNHPYLRILYNVKGYYDY